VNLLLLAIAARAWRGPALSIFLRLSAAVALFSIEAQVVTWVHTGTIRTLVPINLALAFFALLSARWRHGADQPDEARGPAGPGFTNLPPLAATMALAVLVLFLALRLPVRSADSYHLQRVDQITGFGTLAYDPSAPDDRINAAAGVYELLLADLRIPGMHTAAVRFHGLLGLALYVLVIGVIHAWWFPVRRRWLLAAYLVVPVVFHQLVLVNHDLFGALPAVVALAWLVARGTTWSMGLPIVAGALAGFAVGIDIANAPVALVAAGLVLFDQHDWRSLAGVMGGVAAGACAGGLCFTLVENYRVYGGAMRPYLSSGNANHGAGATAIDIVRFGSSLVDLGQMTPRIWPGRGGWGSTFGLPLIWAFAAAAVGWSRAEVRRATLAAAICVLLFAAVYPDADLAHRLVLGPGLLLLGVGVWVADGDERGARTLRSALIPVLVLSALQIAHSAWGYVR
jgi:hypothetical protein